jgi:hypothetical protein
MMRCSVWRANRGIALPVAVLLLLGLTLLAHTAYHLAATQLEIAMAMRAKLSARIVAERELRRWTARAPVLPELRPDERRVIEGGRVLDRVEYSVAVNSLGAELRLLEVLGTEEASGATYRVMRPFWSADPVTRVSEWTAVAMLGGNVSGDSEIQSDSKYDRPEEWPLSRCAPWRAPIDSLFPVRIPRFAPLDATAVSPLTDFPRLGLLDASALRERATVVLELARVTPVPGATVSECGSSGEKWGDPENPSAPCGGYFPLLFRDGDLEVSGGRGQGILVVTGDFRITGAGRFVGVVLSGGATSVEDGATVSGLVESAGPLSVSAGRIEGSVCAALVALDESGELRRPLALPVQAWTDFR